MDFFARRTVGPAQGAEIPDLMKFWQTGPTIFANSGGYLYSIQHFMIMHISVMLEDSGVLHVLLFPPPLKVTAT